MAARRPRRASHRLHARLLAPPALQLRPRRRQHASCSRSGRRSTTPTPRSSCPGTATTTSASLRVDRNGAIDPAEGIRQFVVGTGGAFFTGGLDAPTPQSEVRSEHDVRRAVPHTPADELRLAVRSHRRPELHRLGIRSVPPTGPPAPGRPRARPRGSGHLEAQPLTQALLAEHDDAVRAFGGGQGQDHDQAQDSSRLPGGRTLLSVEFRRGKPSEVPRQDRQAAAEGRHVPRRVQGSRRCRQPVAGE